MNMAVVACAIAAAMFSVLAIWAQRQARRWNPARHEMVRRIAEHGSIQ